MSITFHSAEMRVLALTQTRRDGEVTCALLERAGIQCTVCKDVRTLLAELGSGVGAILLTESAFSDQSLGALVDALAAQPSWSEVSTLVFARERSRTRRFEQGLLAMRNVTLLDLPSSARAMLSAVEAALRGRLRQYQIRDQMVVQQGAETALREADTRKDEFLATLAHELRNPLAAICTAIALLDRDAQAVGKRPHVLPMMDRQSKLLVKLIDDLLDVSRIATGKMMLTRETVDVRTIVEAAVETNRLILETARHELRVTLPDAPLEVSGDAQRLVQVVGNILRNAAKYTPAGGHIDVAAGDGDSRAWVRIRDDGVGIPTDMQDRVFDIFAQVNQTLERSQGGLGIGLSLVKKLVELHGGSVEVDSAGNGLGSTFTVFLPLASSAAGVRPSPEDGPAAAPKRALRVLVIDDNVDVAESFAALLELDGHRAMTAYNGLDGLAASDAFRPDIVFCDIGLPGMSGHEVAKRLRSDTRNDKTMLVAVTGWGTPEDRAKTQRAGFDRHLTKPVNVHDVESILEALS